MENRSKSGQTDKHIQKEQNIEDVIHILKEACYLDPEETSHKIFHKYSKMGIAPILKLPKEELEKLEWKEENGDVYS